MFFTTDFKILLQESEKNLKASTIQSFENMIKRVYVSGLGVSSFACVSLLNDCLFQCLIFSAYIEPAFNTIILIYLM